MKFSLAGFSRPGLVDFGAFVGLLAGICTGGALC